ncbi:hypothetical protein H4R20_001089 [Coemansia guatemalensis]|uniref:Uncharacterized protein n=1 Tax=Coemansia guatemalensis TaxID=2761395 RepID=A0A9W8LTJ4_9FUNG|nr:hypothetical protein H4R20_001089 [Coemansia guatemalensis]
MTQRKRRRRDDGVEELDAAALETTDILGVGGRRRYSECSASAQSRRRAHLVHEICVQAGVEDPPTDLAETKECVQLLQDTLTKSSSMSAVGQQMRADERLNKLASNILALHESVSSEQRTAVFALVANIFTGAELKQIGFSFGTHQLTEARQLAEQKEFAREPRKPILPESKRPKSEEFVSRLQAFLDKRSEPMEDVDGRRVVRGNTIRALHREFVAENVENKISFSTFRALAMEKYRLPQRPTVVEGSSGDDLANKRRADDEAGVVLGTYRPLQPRLDEAPAASSSVRLTAATAANNGFPGFPLLGSENTGLMLNTQSASGTQMISLDIPGFTDNTQLSLPLLLPSLGQASQGMFQTGFDGLDIPTTAAAALFGNMGGSADGGGQIQGMEGTGYMPAIHNLFNMAPALSSNLQQQNSTSQATAESNTLPPEESTDNSLPSTFFYL